MELNRGRLYDGTAAVVIPVGPGKEAVLDTVESVECYCPEDHLVVLVDDCTLDGTFDELICKRQRNWILIRNPRPMGIRRLVHTLCSAYRFVLNETNCSVILRLDQDALIIKPNILSDAESYRILRPRVGLFGVYEFDYNRPRSFESHRQLISRERAVWRQLLGLAPSWSDLLKAAETRGYKPGDNVFGGAYFITRPCLEAMSLMGALNVPYNWHSRLMEDVYFSMAAVAAGFDLGHFAAPDGPLCLEWRGLPYPARELAKTHFKIVHSVDKGKNTDRADNEGYTAREVFRALRYKEPA